MKMKILTVSLILLAILSISSVSASEEVSDELSNDEPVISDESVHISKNSNNGIFGAKCDLSEEHSDLSDNSDDKTSISSYNYEKEVTRPSTKNNKPVLGSSNKKK